MAGRSQDHSRSALFVCLGNICRSPLAEVVMNQVVRDANQSDKWLIDSCGTAAYHIGESPDPRGRATMKKHGLSTTHKCRQLCKEDFTRFDCIFGMDEDNLRDIKKIAPLNSTAKIELLGSYDPEGDLIIEDPYYGGDGGFEDVFRQCRRCCQSFFSKVAL